MATAATRTLLGKIREAFGMYGATWPPEYLREVWEQIEVFAALRDSSETRLRQLDGVAHYNRYLISPVPRMISRASANLLFGEPPRVEPANEADAENMERIVTENDLADEAHRAAVVASSEGEIWGRICVRPDLLDVPIIEFCSRARVIPHFAGRFLVAATFLTEWQEGYTDVYRLFETYDRGAIVSELYRGTPTSLGVELNLSAYPRTAGMVPVIYTGFDRPLAAFIPNSIDADPTRGYADYCGLEDRFFGINRATTIGDTNTELVGRQRALLDKAWTGPGGSNNLGDDVIVVTPEGGDIGEKAPLQFLQYQYEAEQIVTWLDHLIDSTLSFGGTAPQLVGRQLDAAAVSGTALRFKMIHSLLESAGKGRYFDRGLQRLLSMAAVIDSRSTFEIGFGRGWTDAATPPKIERQDGLPNDDLEASTQLASLVGAEAISVEERVAFLHPDWEPDRQEEEVERIKAEQQAPVALPR